MFRECRPEAHDQILALIVKRFMKNFLWIWSHYSDDQKTKAFSLQRSSCLAAALGVIKDVKNIATL